jgi:hypothetical protein
MCERQAEVEAAGISVLAAGFSPAVALADLAMHLEWPWPFLVDTERRLYRRLGLGRTGLRHVYTPGTLARYARAFLTGRAVRPPVEDTRQLGGDAIVRAGTVLRVFRPASPDDRTPPEEIFAAARAAL